MHIEETATTIMEQQQQQQPQIDQNSSEKSRKTHQIALLFMLKGEVDLVYKQLDHFRGAIKNVDKLNRGVQGVLQTDQPDNETGEEGHQNDSTTLITEFVKFNRNYRYWRKRLRKLDRRLLEGNLYDKLYDLYESLILDQQELNSSSSSEEFEVDGNHFVDVGYGCMPGIDDANTNDDDNSNANNNDNNNIQVGNYVSDEIFITEDDIEVQLDTPEIELSKRSNTPTPTAITTFPTITTATTSTNNPVSDSSLFKLEGISGNTRLTRHRQQSRIVPPVPISRNGSSIYHGSYPTNYSSISLGPKPKRLRTQHHIENGKVFICQSDGCQYSTLNLHDFQRHNTAFHSGEQQQHQHQRQLLNCDKCPMTFNGHGELMKHMEVHKGKRFPCTFAGCSVSYTTQHRINSHIKVFHTNELTSLHCNWEGCNYRTYRTDHLQSHMSIHKGERTLKCPYCDQMFRSSSHLSRHKLIHVNNYRCSVEGCGFVTYNNANLQKHQLSHMQPSYKWTPPPPQPPQQNTPTVSSQQQGDKSKESKIFICDFGGCKYSTRNFGNLKVHKASHSDDRPFKCDKCELAFKIKAHLKAHQNIHEGVRYKCTFEGCPVTYSTQRRIQNHIKIYHTKDAPLLHCDFDGCEYSTYRSDHLQNHRTIHYGERTYNCPECNQSYRSTSHLNRHRLVHVNERQFKCDFPECDYSTYRNDSLQKHQAIHTSDLPYKCSWPDCGERFISKDLLYSHKLIHDRPIIKYEIE